MKIILFTPARKTTRNDPLGALSNRTVLFLDRLYSLFQKHISGPSLDIFSPVGTFQPKEVAIENQGRYLLSSKSRSNYFKKEL